MYRRSTLFLAASTSAFQMAALGRASKVRRLASFHDFEEHLLAPSADENVEVPFEGQGLRLKPKLKRRLTYPAGGIC